MRNGSSTSLCGMQPGDPTPEDIAAACREIQRGWSQRDFYIRAGRRVPSRFASSADEDMGRVQAVSVGACLGDGVGEPVE